MGMIFGYTCVNGCKQLLRSVIDLDISHTFLVLVGDIDFCSRVPICERPNPMVTILVFLLFQQSVFFTVEKLIQINRFICSLKPAAVRRTSGLHVWCLGKGGRGFGADSCPISTFGLASVLVTMGRKAGDKRNGRIKRFKGIVTNYRIATVDLEAWPESFACSVILDSVMCSPFKSPNLGVPELDKSFTGSELRTALNRVQYKAVGPDNVSYDGLTKLSSVSRRALLEIFNILWEEGVIPPTWNISFLIPILKPVVLCDSRSTVESISSLSGPPSHPMIIKILKECTSLRARGHELGYQWIPSQYRQLNIVGQPCFNMKRMNKFSVSLEVDVRPTQSDLFTTVQLAMEWKSREIDFEKHLTPSVASLGGPVTVGLLQFLYLVTLVLVQSSRDDWSKE
uniref:Uncharacterized protein n=1 Tax=Timema douglasi TaxID=61478 RepID=A0A7R8VLZ6_TIMDO|nr:unnamed protein product [Timema douglasi]